MAFFLNPNLENFLAMVSVPRAKRATDKRNKYLFETTYPPQG